MSKGLKKVIGTVAMIVIPFVAAPLAAAIFAGGAAMTGIAGIAASGLVGAGLGAAVSAATGQNIAQGALFGGLGGAFAGWSAGNAAKTAATAANATTATTATTAAAGTANSGLGAVGTGLIGDAAGTTAATAASATTQAAAAAAPTLMQAIAKIPATIASKFGPEKMLDIALKVGSSLVAGEVSGGDVYSAMGPEERAAFDAMKVDMQAKYEQDRTIFETQLAAAKAVITQGMQMSPEDAARDAANSRKLADQAAYREAASGLKSPNAGQAGLSQTMQRQYQLGSGRNTSMAYNVGLNTGQTNRLNTIKSGYSMMPEVAPTAPSGDMYAAYAGLRKDNAAAGDAAGKTFASIFGSSPPPSDAADKKRIADMAANPI